MGDDLTHKVLHAIDLLVQQGRAEHTMIDGKPGIKLIDDLDIPAFLKRDKATPAVKDGNNATVPAVKPNAEEEKWRAIEQQRRDHRKAKARGRVAKMMAVKADREALASGKTWNTIKGRWE